MLARVFDSRKGNYFKSEVYAIINAGWYEKQLVVVPCESGDYLKFYDCLDRESSSAKVLINKITCERPAEWITLNSNSVKIKLKAYSSVLSDDERFFKYSGYPWLFEEKATMVKLLGGESVPVCGSIFEDKLINERIADWNYIEALNDIDFIMKTMFSFHDSIIKSIGYISGGFVFSDKYMRPFDDVRTLTMIIDSQITDSIEMVFEGVTAFNLRPAGDNMTSEIYEASLFVKDCTVYFCDGSVSGPDTSYPGTWITSYSMRWRFIL